MYPEPHPALRDLARFLGTWSIAAQMEGQEEVFGAQSTITWLDGGAYLLERTVADPAAHLSPEALAASPIPNTRIFGYDDTAEIFSVLYADNRAVARVYQMRLTGDRWEMWRDAPGFGQRFVATFGPDGRTITGDWELSLDNRNWKHDIHLTYTKVD